MRGKTHKIICSILCLIFLSSTAVFAREEISVTNHIETGVIDIELDEYQSRDDGGLVPWEDKTKILPGDEISKIPRITNKGYDCYVRAKLNFSSDVISDYYYGLGENWVLCKDGYLYYTEVLKNGEYTDIFQGIKIPTDFSQDFEEETFQLIIDVDAIQIQNFVPDYDAEHPWGDIKIEKCIQDGNYQIQSLEASNPKSFEIQYDRVSKSLIKNADDLFENIPVLFPGDTYSDILELENTSNNKVKLYFNTYSKSSKLLDGIQLKIVLKNDSSEKTIYNGSLNSTKLAERFLLTELKGREQQKLEYTISIPKEFNNKYTLLNDSVRWIFSAEEIIPDKPKNNIVIQFPNDIPQLGDVARADIALLIMIISGTMLTILLIKSKSNVTKRG